MPSSVGTAVIVPLVLWLLWDLWSGSLNPLRAVPYDDFYDLQARAMFHGHLYLPNGKMGIEAFVHDGRQYTYFGLFPSIIRMPILLVTDGFDGQLTAPSILIAWVLTAVFSALMLWRLRILMRGEVLLGRAEAASYGVLMATIMGGSVILYLAATPFIYNEDFAWSIPLTVGSLFALLGVLEKPTRGRVLASGLLISVPTSTGRLPAGPAASPPSWWPAGSASGGARRPTDAGPSPWSLVGAVPFLVGCAGHLRQVRHSRRPAHGRSGVGQRQRPPALLPGRQRREGLQLRASCPAPCGPTSTRSASASAGSSPSFCPPAKPASWIGAVMDQSYPTASFTDHVPSALPARVLGRRHRLPAERDRQGHADPDHSHRCRSRGWPASCCGDTSPSGTSPT